MHYGLNTTFTVHQVLIALWESTLLRVFELVVDNIPLVVWCENWLCWAWWQLELDLEGPSSGIWREYGVDVEWFSKTEKNFSLKERKAHFLSLTQYSLGVELKFVECVNFCCWAWLKYAVTLKENPLNVTWFWWAWLKSLLTLIKNLLNVKTILLLEFCTIWLSIGCMSEQWEHRLAQRRQHRQQETEEHRSRRLEYQRHSGWKSLPWKI